VVPTDFNPFFGACASVSGALIGLLFVAISVSPEKLSSENENVEHQVKAAAAFAALANTLIVALFALTPGNGFGEALFFLACVGLAGTAGLLIFFVVNRSHEDRVRLDQILLLAGSFVLYTLQLLNGLHLWHVPHDVGAISAQAEVLVVFFILAIARAWDLVGARNTGFVTGVIALARKRHTTETRSAEVPGPER
jgi:hypothetical protein